MGVARFLCLGTACAVCTMLTMPPATAQELNLRAAGFFDQARVELAEGRGAEARRLLREALAIHPRSAKILRALCDATEPSDPDWPTIVHRWAEASATNGRVTPDQALRQRLGKDARTVAQVEKARAAAVHALRSARQGLKGPGAYVLAAAYREILEELGAPPPDRDARRFLPETDEITAALARLPRKLLQEGNLAEALWTASSLRGLATQAGFEHLRRKTPDLEQTGRAAAGWMRRIRARMAELEKAEPFRPLPLAEQAGFTKRHARRHAPAVALSPNRRYRIETTCGYETLQAAAEQVELHHAALAKWFGKDPFGGVQGTVRIVATHEEQEAEGQPFWWTRGFQRGNTTVLRFAFGHTAALGPLLTHELTHRFDHVIYPGMPAWMREGRAVWTAGAHVVVRDRSYGKPAQFERLIRDDVKDYRDNYTAGHALWVYLSTWREKDEHLYRARLEKYLEALKLPGKDPQRLFLRFFADGQEGRPAGCLAFAGKFHEFLEGMALGRPDWTTRDYPRPVRGRDRGRAIYERPTWPQSWRRAPPRFGQFHAGRAGETLARLALPQLAVRALEWSLHVDGVQPGRVRLLAELLEKSGAADAAWAARWHLVRFGHASAPPAGPPPRTLGPRSALARYLEVLRAAALHWLESSFERAARRLSWRAAGLGQRLGQGPADPAARPQPLLAAEALGATGWQEDYLLDYGRYRKRDLWHVTPEGDLVVGLPKGTSGAEGHGMRLRHVFVRTHARLEGDCVVRTGIRLLSHYVDGTVVLGHEFGERNVRLRFKAGDPQFAAGRSERKRPLDSLSLELGGTREHETALAGGICRARTRIKGDGNSFDLVLLVRGPQIHCFVDGRYVTSHYDLLGRPIAGHIGLAARVGAYRAGHCTVRRLGRQEADGVPEVPPFSLANTRDLVHRPIAGLPKHPHGCAILWFPGPRDLFTAGKQFQFRAHQAALKMGRVPKWLGRAPHPCVSLPKTWPEKAKQTIRDLAEKALGPVQFLDHDLPPYSKPMMVQPFVVFVDPFGVVRARGDSG
ncbi:MAG: hypothetical protein ACYS0K_18710, partial [Planctomycetota bacterium]